MFWGNRDMMSDRTALRIAEERVDELEQRIEEMLARCCENCKHWEMQPAEEDGLGVCRAADYPPKGRGLAMVQNHFECLLTKPEFSCNQWEAKE